ncbi:MAG: ribosome biogenesis factor YjgA [Gammaproteobacteria bacterium]
MNTDDPATRPSRTRSKRAAEALQSLGDELVALPAKQLEQLPLPEHLREALALAQTITSRGALRRQRQYVGRLMRAIDPAPIRAKLEELRGANRVSRARFQNAEHWRARLLSGDRGALPEFLRLYPQADPDTLAALLRDGAREAIEGRPPRRTRELFRYIHSLN